MRHRHSVLRPVLLCALLCALLVVGCVSATRAPSNLSWRPRFEAGLADLDRRLDEIQLELDARPLEPDQVPAVLRELALLGARDRLVHGAWSELLADVPPVLRGTTGSRLARRVAEVQVDNVQRLEPLLDRHGWFTISDFGPGADRDAWRVIQHADARPELQARVLLLLEGLAEVGETDPAHYAYLADRVAVARGDDQMFGTQGRCTVSGWKPHSIAQPEQVDLRRAIVGLPSLSDYIVLVGENCP